MRSVGQGLPGRVTPSHTEPMEASDGLIELLGKGAPDASALLAPGRTPLAYAGLRRFVQGVASGLRAQGIARTDRVALVVENGAEAASAFLAVASAAVSAPLNPNYRAREFELYLDDMHAKAVLVESTLDTAVRDVARRHRLAILELRVDQAEDAGVFQIDGVDTAATVDDLDPNPEDIALLLHTSGTTSFPKLVPLTHRNLLSSACNVARTLHLAPTDRCLNVMPLFHIHGIVASLLASLHSGASIACMPGFHQVEFFGWLDEFHPTWYTAVPTMHAAVVGRAQHHEETLLRHRLRFVRSSSASLPSSVANELEQLLRVPVIEAYGMTEAAHQIASNALANDLRKRGTVGRAAGPELCILDASWSPVPPCTIGEVAIRGENVFPGYDANPETTAESLSSGWFRTGDEGFVDEDGFLTLRGRIKEIINRGGEKISPFEVEELLLRHEAVAQAVTFAMPDPRLGEEVAAAVVLAPGSSADVRELQHFVGAQLAAFKVPRRIVVLDEIPKGATGKIQRIGLADRLGLKPAEGIDVDRRPNGALETELTAIWRAVLGRPDVGVADDFFALGGDSILAAEAVARIRDLVGDPDFPLLSIILAPTAAAMARELAGTIVGEGHAGAIPLQPSGTRSPLFIVHQGDGEVLPFVTLARRLGDDQPTYGLRARGIDDGNTLPSSIPEVAAGYLEDIRRVQPRGPYQLGGFCLGGPIAFEMAAQLRRSGEDVAALILIDPRFRRPDGFRVSIWLARHRFAERSLVRAMKSKFAHRPRRDLSHTEFSTHVARQLALLREQFVPQPLEVSTTLILSADFEQRFRVPEWYLERLFGWSSTCRRLEGSHGVLFRAPHVDELGQAVRSALQQASEQ